MRERPILFSAPMVRAILDGRKSQTRRVVKLNYAGRIKLGAKQWHPQDPDARYGCPYGVPGDRLWVRETWRVIGDNDAADYRATYVDESVAAGIPRSDAVAMEAIEPWRPSIHMPRWASRITLEVTDVRVERLQEMDGQAPYPGECDAIAEGVHRIHHGDGAYYYSAFRDEPHPKNWCDPTDAFRELWESINGAGSWGANPWVWVVSFKRIEA